MSHNLIDESSPQAQSRQAAMDEWVGYILLCGVLLSMALITVGLVWRYAKTGDVASDYQISGMNMADFALTEFRAVRAGDFRPRLFINLGIVVLMLTPFFRVAVSVIYFMFALKNWKYTLFTAFVLAVLTYSLFLR